MRNAREPHTGHTTKLIPPEARRRRTASVATVAAAVVCLVLLSGCGGSTPPSGEAAAGDVAAKNVAAPADGASGRPRPNINVVIFLIDTLRADRLGAYGYAKHPNSPAIDALAAEGIVFEQASSPASWTLPSVASLMTSTFSCEHGVTANQQIPEALPTLAQRLHGIGYVTLGLYANSMVSDKYGFGRGFDDYRASNRNDPRTIAPVLNSFVGSSGKPFFLYVHNLEPHNPYHFAPPHTDGFPDVGKPIRKEIEAAYKTYRKLTRVDFAAGQPLGTTDNSAEQDAAMAVLTRYRQEYSDLYDASVRLADAKIGATIEMLKQAGVWDRTLFILLSDHGEEMHEHGGWIHDHSAYQELLHVPLIVKLPAGQLAGVRVSAPVSLVDVLPTILDILERPDLAQPARGRSMMPLARAAARGESTPAEPRVVAMRWNTKKYYRPWKERRGDINLVARHGRWKGIWNAEVQTFELYDLSADPGEQENVAETHQSLADELRGFLDDWHTLCVEGGENLDRGSRIDDLSAEELENLRSLGYVD